MLRSREPEAAGPSVERDPLLSLTVLFLGLIAVGLFAAAILAVYTYSTPGVEAPLVIAISLGFGLVLTANLIGRAVREWRASR
jgi:hypothetical protein